VIGIEIHTQHPPAITAGNPNDHVLIAALFPEEGPVVYDEDSRPTYR